jgi:hypothetical protein
MIRPPQEELITFAKKRLGEIFPQLATVEIKHKYGGLIDFTPDWVPVISAVDKLPGLHVSAGFSGHGFGIGPAAGRARGRHRFPAMPRSSIPPPIATAASSMAAISASPADVTQAPAPIT